VAICVLEWQFRLLLGQFSNLVWPIVLARALESDGLRCKVDCVCRGSSLRTPVPRMYLLLVKILAAKLILVFSHVLKDH
jgi:hypothetical protein